MTGLCRPPFGVLLDSARRMTDEQLRAFAYYVATAEPKVYESWLMHSDAYQQQAAAARRESEAITARRRAELAARREEAAEFERAEAIYHAGQAAAATIRSMIGGNDRG